MTTPERAPDEAAELVRSSNAFLAHVLGLVLALPFVLAAGYFGDRRWLFGAAAALFVAGAGAIAAGRTVVRVRGARMLESLLEDETRTRARRTEARFMGALLMLLGLAVSYIGIVGVAGLSAASSR